MKIFVCTRVEELGRGGENQGEQKVTLLWNLWSLLMCKCNYHCREAAILSPLSQTLLPSQHDVELLLWPRQVRDHITSLPRPSGMSFSWPRLTFLSLPSILVVFLKPGVLEVFCESNSEIIRWRGSSIWKLIFDLDNQITLWVLTIFEVRALKSTYRVLADNKEWIPPFTNMTKT